MRTKNLNRKSRKSMKKNKGFMDSALSVVGGMSFNLWVAFCQFSDSGVATMAQSLLS